MTNRLTHLVIIDKEGSPDPPEATWATFEDITAARMFLLEQSFATMRALDTTHRDEVADKSQRAQHEALVRDLVSWDGGEPFSVHYVGAWRHHILIVDRAELTPSEPQLWEAVQILRNQAEGNGSGDWAFVRAAVSYSPTTRLLTLEHSWAEMWAGKTTSHSGVVEVDRFGNWVRESFDGVELEEVRR